MLKKCNVSISHKHGHTVLFEGSLTYDFSSYLYLLVGETLPILLLFGQMNLSSKPDPWSQYSRQQIFTLNSEVLRKQPDKRNTVRKKSYMSKLRAYVPDTYQVSSTGCTPYDVEGNFEPRMKQASLPAGTP